MGKYLIQASYTAEGTKGLIKDGGTSRKEMVEKMIGGLGGKMEAFYFSFGNHDVYVICDLPDSATVSAVSLTINSSGVVTTSTTVLITPEEIDSAAKKTVNYRPPGK
jgi:uncharacterized protein with GYD domain